MASRADTTNAVAEAATLGTVRTLKEGYGFIAADDHGRDCFFHCSDLQDLEFCEQLLERRVSFDIELSSKGRRARNIQAANVRAAS